jgi:hypothetical protein
VKVNISGWGVVVTLSLAYMLFDAIASGFTLSSVSYLLLAIVIITFEPLGSRVVYWIRERREGDRVAGADGLLRASSNLLPGDVRERYLDEWLDDLQCRRDQGRLVWPAAVWIVLRSVLPLTVRGRREQNGRKESRVLVHYELVLGREGQGMDVTTNRTPLPNSTPLTSTQRAMSMVIDVTTVVVLMLAVSYMFGGLRMHDGRFTVELREVATALWLLCIVFYFYIPRILGQETFSKRLSRRFAW